MMKKVRANANANIAVAFHFLLVRKERSVRGKRFAILRKKIPKEASMPTMARQRSEKTGILFIASAILTADAQSARIKKDGPQLRSVVNGSILQSSLIELLNVHVGTDDEFAFFEVVKVAREEDFVLFGGRNFGRTCVQH